MGLMRSQSGSIGIGAMIVFIALILVAAIASTVIIKSVEELSVKSDDSIDDRWKSKIEIQSIQVFNYEPCWQSSAVVEDGCTPAGHHEMLMWFTVEGDVSLKDSEVYYVISCPETRTVVTSIRTEPFTGSSTWDSARSVAEDYRTIPFNQGQVVYFDNFMGTAASGARAVDLEPGTDYAIMLDLYDNNNNFDIDNEGCRISLDYEVELMVMVEGGMDTYAIIDCKSTSRGSECY
jgi:hypothetical protein